MALSAQVDDQATATEYSQRNLPVSLMSTGSAAHEIQSPGVEKEDSLLCMLRGDGVGVCGRKAPSY